MKFTLSWLKEHLDTDEPLDRLADKLTMIGLEVENIEDKAKALAPFTIARVIAAEQHPNADRLRVCMVDTGDGGAPVQVVCGAPNARAGLISVFSAPGTYIPGKNITLGVGTIRGVESRGMLCSAAELQISEDHDGIMELPADAPLGKGYAEWAGLGDPVIEINLTPNRQDCTGVHGIARDLSAADMGKLIDPAIKPIKGEFPSPVKVIAEEEGIPVLQPEKPRGEEFESALRSLAPDISVVVAYGHLLPQSVIDLPPLGTLNIHASLLPRWRGAAPIQAAILAGDAETGVSIMRMVKRMDAGNVILQAPTPILDDETYGNTARWEKLDRDWYRSGRAYRDMDAIDGTPNPMFRRWLEHPAYDAYWQAMIPYREEFAAIDIPVLSTTGYFDGARVGALYYFQEHTKRNPGADHTLVIGPWGHLAMQAGVPRNVDGYDVDPGAQIDLQALRYDWFDHVFRGKPKPALLQDKVNYQVMGADAWRSAPSVEAMANAKLRFRLEPVGQGPHRLAEAKPAKVSTLAQTVDFRDRSDAEMPIPTQAIVDAPNLRNGLLFLSAPITEPTEIAGLFSGELDFVVNKRDLDISVTLYEKMTDGRYFQLAWHLGRASFAGSRSERRLLTPGKRTRLAFTSEHLVSRKLAPGSRLAIVLAVNRQPDMQINYGSGKDVSDETIDDAGEPLRVEWSSDSHIDVPIWR